MALCQTFDLPEDDFLAQAGSVIDVEQWLQAFAFSTLRASACALLTFCRFVLFASCISLYDYVVLNCLVF